jgi:hypothetical protein
MNEDTLTQKMIALAQLLGRLDAGTEWDRCDDVGHVCEHGDPKRMFGQIYLFHDYEAAGPRKVRTAECGSFKTETAPALYRLLYLTAPKRIDFSDMYKSCSLFALVSPDSRFCAQPQFFKYELAIYLSGAEDVVKGREHGVTSGIPGIDNGIGIKDPGMKMWSELLQRCLARKWDVYSGNNFEV